MEIEEFINHIEKAISSNITRGSIIDHLSELGHDWVLVLKALLISNNKRYIHKEYLLEKLYFMKKNPLHAHVFLSLTPLSIYKILNGDY